MSIFLEFSEDGKTLLSIPKDIEEVIIKNEIEYVADEAGKNCYNLKKVVLPETVKKIGKNAFDGCLNLENINFPKNVCIDHKAFASTNLKEVDLSFTTLLGGNTFDNCKNLEKVIMPKNMKVFKTSFFHNCSVKELMLPENLESIFCNALADFTEIESITLPKTFKEMDDPCFNACILLKKIDVDPLNENFKSVDGVLFDKTGEILYKFPQNFGKMYIVPKNTKVIGNQAFAGNKILEKIILPEGLEIIKDKAFMHSHFTDITFPVSLKKMEKRAFAYSKLKALYVPNIRFDEGAFCHSKDLEKIIFDDDIKILPPLMFTGCENLIDVELPNLIEIKEQAFQNCYRLKNIKLPDSLTFIDNKAFFNCDLSDELIIPQNITIIGEKVFSGNVNLKNVTINSKRLLMNKFCFLGDTNLENVTFNSKFLEINKDNIFEDCENLKYIYLDKSLLKINPIFASKYNAILKDLIENIFDLSTSFKQINEIYKQR